MAHTKEQLKADLSRLGVRPGDTVLMHSSYKALGGIEGGAKTFFEGFMELLGDEGTLVLPALSFATVTRENPEFDRQTTPSCVGYLTEYFRTSVPGVVRSLHPTHSCCALGKRAQELTGEHELDLTPVGPHSPFAKLPGCGGKILMLGCGTRCNTSMHGVEETAEPPYCLSRGNPVEYVLRDGDRVLRQTALRHHFLKPDGTHYAQRYDRLMDLLAETDYSHGFVLDAECWLMNAPAVWETGRRKLLETPWHFVEG